MAGAGKTGASLAGGVIIGPGAPSVLVEGTPVSTIGDLVVGHGPNPHIGATVVSGSATVFAEGRPVTVEGLSVATCAHGVTLGAPTVQIGR